MDNKKGNSEHILVCLSSSPSNPKVIEAGYNMAKNYNCDFSALYIETSKILDKEDKERLNENSKLAKELGAKITYLNGNNIEVQIASYAKKKNITKLILGRSYYKPNKIFTPPSFIDKLIPLIPEIDIYVIPDKAQKLYVYKNKIKDKTKITIDDTIKVLFTLFIATITGFIFHLLKIYDANIILIYILAIIFIAHKTKSKLYGIISSLLAVFIYDFFFIEPYFSTQFNNKNYALTFIIMFFVALISSNMTKKIQNQAESEFLKTYRTEKLLNLSQKLQDTTDKNSILDALKEQLKMLLECSVKIKTNCEKKVKNITYFDIKNEENVFGIIEISKKNISMFEENLIQAMIRETVLALENNEITKKNNELILKNKQEELRTTLLRTISHDLRTPLTSISGYAEILINNSEKLNEEKKKHIYTDIYDDSNWLLNLVENLLSITRFDKDKIEIKKEVEYIPDIINSAISHLGRKKDDYKIKTIFSDEDLYSEIDGRLIAQVIFNLVDNAMKYSPINSTIIVKAEKENDDIVISIADEGSGISDEEKLKIFDLFYSINSVSVDSRRGLGLGLALCKTVIMAHSSAIEVKDNIPNGTIMSFKLKGLENE